MLPGGASGVVGILVVVVEGCLVVVVVGNLVVVGLFVVVVVVTLLLVVVLVGRGGRAVTGAKVLVADVLLPLGFT